MMIKMIIIIHFWYIFLSFNCFQKFFWNFFCHIQVADNYTVLRHERYYLFECLFTLNVFFMLWIQLVT